MNDLLDKAVDAAMFAMAEASEGSFPMGYWSERAALAVAAAEPFVRADERRIAEMGSHDND